MGNTALSHHWLTDVVFGWLVGTAWLALMITVHRLYLSVHPGRASRPGIAAPTAPTAVDVSDG